MAAEGGVSAVMLGLLQQQCSEIADLDCSAAIEGFCVEYLSQIDPKSAVEQLLRVPGVKDLSEGKPPTMGDENIAIMCVSLSRILRRLHDFCRCTAELRLPRIEALISAMFFELLAAFLRSKSESHVGDTVLLLEMITNFSSNILLHEG